jgi:hypothetical protein
MKTVIVLCAFLLVGGIYVFYGCKPAVLADTQLGNWVQAAAIGAYPRSNSASFVIGDHAYVGMGYNESIGGLGRLRDFWTFCVDSGWTRKADFPGGARYDAVGFNVHGLGYLGTGFNVYWLNDFYQYDPDQDKWAQTPGTSGNFSKRRGAAVFVYRDQAYIVTGSNSGGMVRDFWRFDPSQHEPWFQLNNITNTSSETFDDGYTDIEREYGTIFVNGSQAYLSTGTNNSMLSSTWAYDYSQRPVEPENGLAEGVQGGGSLLYRERTELFGDG